MIQLKKAWGPDLICPQGLVGRAFPSGPLFLATGVAPIDQGEALMPIDYQIIKELALFQEQYEKLTAEIQQLKVQLHNSPPLAADAPKAEQRAEWRAWLELQVASRQRWRQGLVTALLERGIVVDNVPP